MKIGANKVVHMHYKLTNDKGKVLDNSEGQEPLAYIQGLGNIISGLEKEMEGKKAGDKLSVSIAPKDGYGEIKAELIQIVPKSGFEGGENELQAGMQVQVDTNEGVQVANVTKIDGKDVTLDLNHPLAGIQLNFDIEIMEVRDSTTEELEHKHVHGPGGHHH
ncbi:MAG: peptidylprolyl isomerase [Flavobacteriales bacterium]|nr:peptidylprolyl isomerase [Flavobacteriales bacterium]